MARPAGVGCASAKHRLANARSKVGAETTAQPVWILARRLPEPEGMAKRTRDGQPDSLP